MSNYFCSLVESIGEELEKNQNRISAAFIENLAKSGEVKHFHLTLNMRVCVITLPSGHEVLGKAQVLDMMNDNEDIGKKVAYDNAVNELWDVVGSIAKAVLCR